MAKNQADFTLTFRRLSDAAGDPAADKVRDQFTDPAAYEEWTARWRQRLAEEPQSAAERQAAMRAVNPAFIPRNHRIEAVIPPKSSRCILPNQAFQHCLLDFRGTLGFGLKPAPEMCCVAGSEELEHKSQELLVAK